MKTSELNFMVIEDDDFQRKMLVNMLSSLGAASVCDASNGKVALDRLRDANSSPVDVLLCDLNMPEMDGMEFLRHLGQEHLNIAIVIISALESSLLASVGKMARMYGIKLLGVIEKPVRQGGLKELLSKYERSECKTQQGAAAAAGFSLEEILQGVREKQFEPFFQPKVDFKTGRITGAEALARWIHPQQGVAAPCSFIPQLEQAGEMDGLTFQILEKSARACRFMHDKGYPITVSVNLSLTSLTDVTLADRIIQMVRNAGVDMKHIILEVTESAAMTNAAPALENLARLRMHGFGLSIDDYGTGYSSMQQLTRIAFSELKIDQSFVMDITTNKMSNVIVRSSIEMAHKMQLKSVAEGVEYQRDWDTLKGMECDTAQGYFISKPVHLDAFIEFCAGYSA